MYGAERLAVHGSLEPNGPHPVILISLKNQELAEEESVEEESAEESAEEESMSPSGAAPSVLTLGTFHDLIGKRFHTFEEMCEARLHRSWRSGICPCGKKVAESVVVCNSTWADDDRGDVLWFTGQGKGKDQELKQGNLSLANACEANKPIRVIRGHQLKTDIAPSWGYRYDGLYKIIKYQTESHEGRRIWRFLMERLEGQPEAPYKSREESPPPPPPGYRYPTKRVYKEKNEKKSKKDNVITEKRDKVGKKSKKKKKEKKERGRKRATSTSSNTIRKRLQLSSSSSSPSLSSDSERYDDPTSPPLPPPTPTQAFTVPRIYSPSPALVSGKTPMDQFLAVHSGFTSMTNAEILEWIANGLCAFCGASVKPTTYRKHYREHLSLVESYLPKGDRYSKPPYRGSLGTATKSSHVSRSSSSTPPDTPPDMLSIDQNSDLESYEDLLADEATNFDDSGSDTEIDMDQGAYTLLGDILSL